VAPNARILIIRCHKTDGIEKLQKLTHHLLHIYTANLTARVSHSKFWEHKL
jgi:hypothetical protein